MPKTSKKSLENKYQVKLTGPQWILSGAGSARWGYGNVQPCRVVFYGRTLAEVAKRCAQ